MTNENAQQPCPNPKTCPFDLPLGHLIKDHPGFAPASPSSENDEQREEIAKAVADVFEHPPAGKHMAPVDGDDYFKAADAILALGYRRAPAAPGAVARVLAESILEIANDDRNRPAGELVPDLAKGNALIVDGVHVAFAQFFAEVYLGKREDVEGVFASAVEEAGSEPLTSFADAPRLAGLDLDALAALASAATPGPWCASVNGEGVKADVQAGVAWGDMICRVWPNMKNREADATFIAAARDAVPALIAALRTKDSAEPGERSESPPSPPAVEPQRAGQR